MGELQFVLGPSGSGKTEYIDRRIIKESISEPGLNYLFLVPEQSSLAIQTKLVKLHPNGGFFNIEVFGFNRLAYTVFDELNVRTSSVLDDYGKSMLLRSLAGKLKDRLVYYQNSLDKNGFIDQLKSFMSELYQYDISRAELREAVDKLQATPGNDALVNKLKDMLVIFEEFDDYMKDNSMIVAEQTTELLVKKIGQSRRLENTVVIMDGFTGFTPIQLNVIRELMAKVKKIYAVVTIDRESYFKMHMKNHELFYLSRKTIGSLGRLADETHTFISDEIWPEDFGEEIHSRWRSAELVHLEQNIFRYPYKRYTGTDVQDVNISCFATSADEIHSVAATIRYMVNMDGYRYKDIAVVSGNLEKTAELTDRIFPQYGIVYFNDYNQKLKSNAVIDGILALFDLLER
ncbi:MAG: ATP-dependent nuclease, partial [Lachnospiraceae bacterium]|nr:ATP-dependent nuclease [Lachnospiraceae bacterium]